MPFDFSFISLILNLLNFFTVCFPLNRIKTSSIVFVISINDNNPLETKLFK